MAGLFDLGLQPVSGNRFLIVAAVLALGAAAFWVIDPFGGSVVEPRPRASIDPAARLADPLPEPPVPVRDQSGTAPPAPASPAPASPAPGAGPSIMSAAEFERLIDRTYRELPTLEDLQLLSEEEAHDYPEPVALAGTALGAIAQAVDGNPALKPQATDFYVQCARDGALVTPVRALCYSHVIGDPKAPSEETLPSEVVRLAKLALEPSI